MNIRILIFLVSLIIVFMFYISNLGVTNANRIIIDDTKWENPSGYFLYAMNKDFEPVDISCNKSIFCSKNTTINLNTTTSFELFYKNWLFENVMIGIDIEKIEHLKRKEQILQYHKIKLHEINKLGCVLKVEIYKDFKLYKIFKFEDDYLFKSTIGPNHAKLINHVSTQLECELQL